VAGSWGEIGAAGSMITVRVEVAVRPAGSEAPVSDDGFALAGFPEFVRSGDGFCWDASRELEPEELTDIEVAGEAAALRRAASWALVYADGLGSAGPALV
jgi:hypothetical protein